MATVFCFTSTGNSLYAAKKIAGTIGGNVVPMNGEPVQCNDDVIGFVFPVYFWGLPRMVSRFVANMRITNKDAYVFAVITCGGPVFGVLGLLKGLLKSKHNIRLRYGARIIAGSNYLPEFEVNYTEALGRKVDQRIWSIAKAVKNREVNRVSPLSFHNRLILKLYPGENSDQYFTTASTCTGCATCQRVCPSRNISLEAGKPRFQHKCEHCLACLHHCPARAIDWKENTKGKERFRNPGVSLEELIAFHGRDKAYSPSCLPISSIARS